MAATLNEKKASSPAEQGDNVQPGYLGLSPQTGKLPPKGERRWVDRPEQLLQAVDTLKQATVVAVDAEFMQVRSHIQGDSQSSSTRLALLQMAVDRHCFVIDALRLNDLSPLSAVVSNPDIMILLHGAGADMRVMADRGLLVVHYCDLEAASRSIFGQHESSLAGMLHRAFNVRLDKSLQRTDWTRRPLPPAMIAYAARDAEMTLALYSWLHQHYAWALKLHEYTDQVESVAPWIEPFLRGTATTSPDVAVTEAKVQGIIRDKAQMIVDCRAALATLTQPIRRNRLLRLISDLSLVELVPDLELFLKAPTADERAASVRALGRLGVKSAQEAIVPLLEDPVHEVRKAAQTALHNLGNKQAHPPALPTKIVDGTRSWSVGETSNQDDDDGWKARLRSIMGQ